MSTCAVTDYGTLFKRAGVTVGEVINIAPPKRSNPAMDATSHSSGGKRERISAMLVDMAPFNVMVNFVSAVTQDSMLSDIDAGVPQTYSIVHPGGMGTWAGSALVTDFQPAAADAKSPKPLTGTFTLAPTGAWTLT